MEKFKGTPGPWKKEVKKGNIMVTGGKIYPNRPDFNSMNIKVGYISEDDCGNPGCCRKEEHANAQLISEAPNLLEACKQFLLYVESGDENQRLKAHVLALLAVERAQAL